MILRALLRVLLRILFRYTVRGPIPEKAPEKLVIIANHQSFTDPLFIQAYCPFDIWWITHTTIAAQWHFRVILRFVKHLVVDTANPLAMKQVVELVNSGKPVCIFPEGRLTVTGSLMKVYDGFAFIAFKTGAQLLSVNFSGLVYSYFNRLGDPFPKIWRPKVTVDFFPLFTLPEPVGASSKIRRRNASHQIRRTLETNWFASQPMTNLFDRFLDSVDTFGRDSEIVSDIRFTPESFGQILKGALALGRLVAKYTREGERVGVLMPNASPAVMLLYGLFYTRRIPAMMNYSAGVDGMQSAIQTAGIKTIITSKVFLDKGKLTAKVAQLKDVQVLQLEDIRPKFNLFDKLWLILYALPKPRRVSPQTVPDDEALVLFTSGSEGKPKGVVLSHRAIQSNIAQLQSIIDFSCRDKFLASLPLFHSFGLMLGALVPLTTGTKVFLYPSPLHYRMIPEMAYDQDCTILAGTGTFLAKYAKFGHEYDFRSVRYIVSAAEKLPEPVNRLYMDRFGIRIMEGYGVTECSPAISLNTPYFSRQGTVGKVVPGMEYAIVPVPGIDRGGMLHVTGPNLMKGYLLHDAPGKVQPAKSSVKGEGWYETGDIVEEDAEGFLRILGRVKRFAKVAGEMVSLEVVEQIALLASPHKEHASSTVASAKRGEVILLFTTDNNLKREQLLQVCRERGLPEIALPRHIQWVDKLPKLGSGKVDYVTLKEMAVKLHPEEAV